MTTYLTPSATHTDVADYARRLHCVAEQSNSSVDAVLEEATRAAVTLITPADHAGITVVTDARHHQHNAVAATSHIPTLFAALETSHHEGPCRDSLRQHRVITVHDFSDDDRWPSLHRALSHGTSAESCLVVPMTTATNELVGALALYADNPHVFGDADIALAESLATHTALAVATVNRAMQFATALASRDVIGQAKGMIMERFTIDATEAFGLLTKLSQDSNIRVTEIAARLVSREQAHLKRTHPSPSDHGDTP